MELNDQFFKDVKRDAIAEIKRDRDFYEPVYNTVIEYVKKHSLIVSDIYDIIGKSDHWKKIYAKSYKIYSSEPLKHANAIVNQIHKDVSTLHQYKDLMRYLRLRTVMENQEFIIDFDFRPIATIYKLQKHKNKEPHDIIKPTQLSGVYYLPAEIEIIDVYHTWYDPSRADDHEEAREQEAELFKLVAERKEKGFLGAKSCKDLKKELLEQMKLAIVSDFIYDNEDVILIGAWAYDYYKLGKKQLCANKEKIQVLYAGDPADLVRELQKFVSDITKFKITIKEQELHIPKDFRTTRYTCYINVAGDKAPVEKPFMDIFNCLNFELVPCVVHDKINIATRPVLLRFMFIDLWILKVVKVLGYLTAEVLDKKIEYLFAIIQRIKSDDFWLGDVVKYKGVHRPESMDKKINIKEGKRYFPYYPGKFYEDKKEYRVIG
jgi:hypothetical protein